MRAKHLFLFLLFAITACNNSGTSVPTLKFSGLRGNISIYKEYQYYAKEKFGEIVSDGLAQVMIREFDKDGRLLKHGVYDEDGDYIIKVEEIYENGLLSSEVLYQSNNKEKMVSRVAERRKDYIKWLVNEGTDDETIAENFYDGLYYKALDNDGIISFEMFFDKAGRAIEQKNYSEGKLVDHYLQEYDNNGDLIKTISHADDDSPSVTTYTYPEYDKKGNWITQYTWEDGEVLFITKREISYR